jgi:hypothetical protein
VAVEGVDDACGAPSKPGTMRLDRGRQTVAGTTGHPGGRRKEEVTVEWIIVIVLVLLLLGALGPRAGWYGAAGALWDILSLIILIALVVWLLNVLGVFAT